jgi:hypothetical protein
LASQHVLDWFHLSMRIQPVAQSARRWSSPTDGDRQEGARLADAIGHVSWHLWHGQVQQALDLIGDTLVILDAAAETASPVAAAARKVARVLRELEIYVVGQSELIIDYAPARQCAEPIATASTTLSPRVTPQRRLSFHRGRRRFQTQQP